jgi:predicted DsbA family dithiol-disulfide isomerase
LACLALSGPGRSEPAPKAGPPAAKVKVELFVMSQCPFCVQAEQLIADLRDRFGQAVEVRLEFIGEVRGGQLTSLHGPSEVDGDKIQICAQQQAGAKALDLAICMNENQRTIPKGWDACAKRLGLDEAALSACARGEQGSQLLSASFALAERRGAQGSPSIFIDEVAYAGPRSEVGLARAVCAAFGDRPSPVCAELPPLPKISMILFIDSRCADCQHEELGRQMAGLLPGLAVERVDYAAPGGPKRYRELGLRSLPAVLLDREVEKSDSFDALARFLDRREDGYQLRLPPSWDPTREICDNGRDDTGDGKVDCQHPDCQGALACRPQAMGKLEVYVMSMCPYGTQALDAMRAVFGQLGEGLEFEVHYIASEQDGQFSALHGAPEVAENIRQLCARSLYPKDHRYLDYIWCRGPNIRSDAWRECAKGNGLDADKIAACSEGDAGRRLLRADIRLAREAGIGASPTWLVNNRHLFHGIDAVVVVEQYCKHNPGVAGCGGAAPGGGKERR